MSGITDILSTKVLGATETVTIKKYGDGSISFVPVLVTSAATTITSASLTAVVSTNGLVAGMPISGAGIPVGTTVVSFVANTSILMSAVATATAAGVSVSVNKSRKAKGYETTALTDAEPDFMINFFAALQLVA